MTRGSWGGEATRSVLVWGGGVSQACVAQRGMGFNIVNMGGRVRGLQIGLGTDRHRSQLCMCSSMLVLHSTALRRSGCGPSALRAPTS